jgi:penicillin amidase
MLVGGLYVGFRGIGLVPPVGPLIDPANGIWAVARTTELPAGELLEIAELNDSVRIVYDRRAVPHIWATTVDDAMRALGYVVARDRLFQLELQTRATTGRLTELLGEIALAEDQRQRSLGLAWSAESDMAALDSTSRVMPLLSAYAEGVNAWIDGMNPRDLPFEYRILGARPLHWEPVNTLHLIKRMGYTLAFSSHDLRRMELEQLIGVEATDALFPVRAPIQEPIEPNGRDAPRFDFRELPEPARRNVGRSERRKTESLLTADPPIRRSAGRSGEVAGSNNWAVSPSRSANSHALLAGDPHLQLTLPSIWYEAHIVVPGQLDVYGVTIPGIPGIVIGFNRDVAWSFTNTQADVLDYYREVVDDQLSPTEYSVDGEWRALEQRIENFYGQDGDLLATDTVYFSHRGPLVQRDHSWLSIRWTVLEPSGAIDAFFGADRARSVDEWLTAMERFHAPPQNGIVADRNGNIAIRSIGHFPIRAGDGSGTKLRVGVVSANDWRGYWPVERYPFSLNPAQGFLASANQQPKDPVVDNTYLGVNWIGPWRAMRINQLLRADTQVTSQAMRRFQTDPGSARADLFVPVLLEAAERVLEQAQDDNLAEAARLLAEWDRRYTRDNERAVLFEAIMAALTYRVWDELATEDGSRLATPGDGVLAQLLEFPESGWWDDWNTEDIVERRDDVIASSLRSGLERTIALHGPPDSGGWRWDQIRHATVLHLLGVSALSAVELPIQGGRSTLNPSSGIGDFGASWRMVVEMSTDLRAWSTYPGGQSGNPVSPWYDNRISQWVDGELEEVLFPRRAGDLANDDVAGTLTLYREDYR